MKSEPAPRRQKYLYCKACAGPLRPKGQPAAKFPGTKGHAGNGYCTGCYASNRRNSIPLTNPDPAHTRALTAYIHARRNRGTPEEGHSPCKPSAAGSHAAPTQQPPPAHTPSSEQYPSATAATPT